MTNIFEESDEHSRYKIYYIVIFCLLVYQTIFSITELVATIRKKISTIIWLSDDCQKITYKTFTNARARLFHLRFLPERSSARALFTTSQSFLVVV
jgi:hypothetical protein